MAQRNSTYVRQDRDLYITPAWVTEELLKHIRKPRRVWEPASGTGSMADTIRKHTSAEVLESDISTGSDFLTTTGNFAGDIITNPPFNLARQFIEHALQATKQHQGLCAFLLKVDFDSGKTRRHLFQNHPAFLFKLTLLQRIVWFDNGPATAPSENHAWFVWDWKDCEFGSRPYIVYGP
jgi:hypothetical protein